MERAAAVQKKSLEHAAKEKEMARAKEEAPGLTGRNCWAMKKSEAHRTLMEKKMQLRMRWI